jgi:hemolysin III
MSAVIRPRHEELANALTHGVGALLSLAGLVTLLVLAALRADAWTVVAVAIFGGSLLLLYTGSALYHGLHATRARAWLQRLDHAGIFLLIAGTWTPFLLVNLRGPWGWTFFGLVWGLALPCILVELLARRRPKALMVGACLGLGWMALAAAHPLLEHVPPGALGLLLAGGLCYSLGVVFYIWKRLPWNHAIWHLFVLAGSLLHYFSVWQAVLPD